MKLMIASDLHGSAYYCRLLMQAFQRQQADKLVLLGDLLYHGPRNPLPKEYDTPAVTSMLNGMADKLLCVRGNCDAEVDQMVLTFPMLADSTLLYADGNTFYATHGHLHGPENPPPLPGGAFLLCGHTHLPVRRECGHFTYLNPGSVSLPKQDTPHSYLTVTDGAFLWHDLESGQTFTPLG